MTGKLSAGKIKTVKSTRSYISVFLLYISEEAARPQKQFVTCDPAFMSCNLT